MAPKIISHLRYFFFKYTPNVTTFCIDAKSMSADSLRVHQNLKKIIISKFSPLFAPLTFLQILCHAHVVSGAHDMHCHKTKPNGVVAQHTKGLLDWSKYKGDSRHLQSDTNFWTNCSSCTSNFNIVACYTKSK